MVLGFISLILTFAQQHIAQLCIPVSYANTMLPCPYHKSEDHSGGGGKGGGGGGGGGHRRLLWYEQERRILAAGSMGAGCSKVRN